MSKLINIAVVGLGQVGNYLLNELMAKKKTGRKNKICAAGIAWAKRTFDTYPSAYANMAASKYCKDPNYAKKSKK